jgi:hypothetical protein
LSYSVSRLNEVISTLAPGISLLGAKAGVLNINTFLGLFFTLFLFHEGGMVGSLSMKSGVNIEFLALSVPTRQIGIEKKVAKIPEQTHPGLPLQMMSFTPE